MAKKETLKSNPINNFISSMSKAGGFARPSQFEIKITPPMKMDLMQGMRIDGTNVPALATRNSAMKALQLMSDVNKQLTLQCSSVSMPAHDLQTQNMQHGSEPGREMVQTHGYAGTIDCSFYLSRDLREKHYFELWQSLAVDNFTHKANYYDDYVGSIEIYQLSSKVGEKYQSYKFGEGMYGIDEKYAKFEPERTYGIKAIEVFPKTVGAVAYGHDSANQIASLDVRFEFKQWYNIGTGDHHGHSDPKLRPF